MQRIFTEGIVSKVCMGLVFVAVLFVSPVMGQKADAKKSDGPSASNQTPETVTINGKVKAVTDTSLTIVDDKNTELTINLAAQTKITKAGKTATTTDIKANDAVVVVGNEGEDNALTAVTISVT
jgi:preprotein translocase subunit YajC